MFQWEQPVRGTRPPKQKSFCSENTDRSRTQEFFIFSKICKNLCSLRRVDENPLLLEIESPKPHGDVRGGFAILPGRNLCSDLFASHPSRVASRRVSRSDSSAAQRSAAEPTPRLGRRLSVCAVRVPSALAASGSLGSAPNSRGRIRTSGRHSRRDATRSGRLLETLN